MKTEQEIRKLAKEKFDKMGYTDPLAWHFWKQAFSWGYAEAWKDNLHKH